MRTLENFIVEVLGPCKVRNDRSQADGYFSQVLEVEDARGVTWFVKQHRLEDRFRTEVAAYRRWVPVLHGHVPRLRAADDDLRAVVLSAVPGAAFAGNEVDVHRDAGTRCAVSTTPSH